MCLLLPTVALLLPLLGPASSAAQEVEPGGVSLELVTQRTWLSGPRAPLDLRLRVENASGDPIEGFQFTFEVGDRVDSRSALHDTFEDPDSFLVNSSYTHGFLNTRVPPGGSVTRTISDPASHLITLGQATEGGVYPLAITLYDKVGNRLAALATPLIYYPTPPVDRLNLVLVVPLSHAPARSPEGAFARDPVLGAWPLEDALAPGGWLPGVVGALRRHPGLHVGVAPMPRLLEEVDDMSDGYLRLDGEERQVVSQDAAPAESAADFLAELRGLLRGRSVQALRVPYAAPDLVALNESQAPGADLSGQLAEGGEVLRTVLGPQLAAAFDPSWLLAPGGRLDAETLEALQLGRRLNTFFSPDSLNDPAEEASSGCSRPLLTFACAVVVQGATRGLVADAGLIDRFQALAREGSDRADLQRLFAETAMIREELPGVERRVVQATVPALWHPAPGTFEALAVGLAHAPWLETVTPRAALASADTARRSVNREADPVREAPDSLLYEAIDQAAAAVDDFSAIGPPAELLQRLERNVLVAQSRLWWGDAYLRSRAEDYATDSSSEALAQLDNISIGGRHEITLTSRRQSIPLVLFNDNPYPVEVEVHLQSVALDFDEGTVFPRRGVEEGNHPFQVQATARSSGTFPLQVSLYPPGSDLKIAEAEIVVRSTQFNRIALGLTIGALAFLFLFYALRALRRRRPRTQPPTPV
jgi:hypothetical protein